MMKRRNSGPQHNLALLALLIAGLLTSLTAKAQKGADTNVIPLIVMDNVPLSDAIKELARQAGINYIIDPRVSSPGPEVTGRWENRTAEQLLRTLLQQHKLVMVENPATSVARIASKDQEIRPVPATLVGTNTSKVIPVIKLNDIDLDEAINKLAAQANLNVSVDPSVSYTFSGTTTHFPAYVYLRWENLTAKQALVALVDNYDLAMVENATTSSARIVIKTQPTEKSARPEKGAKD